MCAFCFVLDEDDALCGQPLAPAPCCSKGSISYGPNLSGQTPGAGTFPRCASRASPSRSSARPLTPSWTSSGSRASRLQSADGSCGCEACPPGWVKCHGRGTGQRMAAPLHHLHTHSECIHWATSLHHTRKHLRVGAACQAHAPNFGWSPCCAQVLGAGAAERLVRGPPLPHG